jgi:hypothetical protein
MYEKRRCIVSGEYEPSEEEATWTLDGEEGEGGAKITEIAEGEEEEKGKAWRN